MENPWKTHENPIVQPVVQLVVTEQMTDDRCERQSRCAESRRRTLDSARVKVKFPPCQIPSGCRETYIYGSIVLTAKAKKQIIYM